MNNKKDYKTKILLILCILLSIGFVSTAFAYIQASTNEVKNTFAALGGGELFDDDNPDPDKRGAFILDESKVKQDSNGVYSLDTTVARVKGNDYKILPGIDIPKDPMITIKNKTEVPAYLYLEVVNNASGYFDFDLEDCWQLLDGANGLHDGDIYVYSPSTGTTLGAISNLEVGIIEEDVLNTKLDFETNEQKNLTFYAYLAQATIGDETTAYNTCFNKTVN